MELIKLVGIKLSIFSYITTHPKYFKILFVLLCVKISISQCIQEYMSTYHASTDSFNIANMQIVFTDLN